MITFLQHSALNFGCSFTGGTNWWCYVMVISVTTLFLFLLLLYQKGIAEINANFITSFEQMEESLEKSKNENSQLKNDNIFQAMVVKNLTHEKVGQKWKIEKFEKKMKIFERSRKIGNVRTIIF